MKLPFKIYSNKKYWLWKYKIQSLGFRLRRQKFRTQNFFKEEKYEVLSTFVNIKLTLWRITKAITFVSLLFFIEYIATSIWQTNLSQYPNWLLNFQRLIPKPTYPVDRDAVIELISVIATVSGVILALFYPVLATIASTAYAKVHASIRNLLFYEKETQGFLRRLTYLTAFSITVLLFLSFHLLPGNLVLSFLTLYSFITLFGILKIGLGVYNFFEPSTLAGIVITKMRDIIKNVTTEGEYWNEKNFQNYNYKIAFEQIENLSLITNLCVKDDDLKESSFKSSMKSSFFLLQYYFLQKRKIPIDSLWFPNINNHLSYFESDMMLRDLSKNTNTYIQPKVKQNHYWLEERIIDNMSNAWDKVLKVGHMNVFAETILMTYPIFDSLSNSTDLRTGKIILTKLLHNIKTISNRNLKAQNVLNYDDWRYELGSVESYCYGLLRFQVGVIDRVTEFNSNKVIEEFNKINWSRKDTIYLTDFIPDLYELLNNFRRHVLNEYSIEGKRITPDWYFRQSLIAEYLRNISEKIIETIILFEEFLLSLANHFDEENNPLLLSYVTHIGLEDIHKIQFRIEQLKPVLIDINKIEVCKGEFAWAKPDFVSIESLLYRYEQECYSLISKNIEKLSTIKWNNQFPDIFAQSYSLISTHLNQSYFKDDLQEIQKHFPTFLKSSITAFGNLNQIFKHYSKPENISYQTLVDVMQISGIGYIYSVIYNKPDYWLSIKTSWDESFLPSKENIELLTSYYSYYKNVLYGTGINYNENFRRERALADIIERLRITPRDIDDLFVKPFIRDSNHMTFEDSAELFMEIYLFTFIDAKNATTLLRCRDIFENLIWQIENPNSRIYDDI